MINRNAFESYLFDSVVELSDELAKWKERCKSLEEEIRSFKSKLNVREEEVEGLQRKVARLNIVKYNYLVDFVSIIFDN
jgi:hypothetical protein